MSKIRAKNEIFDGIDFKSTDHTACYVTILNKKETAYFGNKLHFQPSLFQCVLIHCKIIKLRDDKLAM